MFKEIIKIFLRRWYIPILMIPYAIFLFVCTGFLGDAIVTQKNEIYQSNNATGLISETTEIKNTFGIDMLSSEVVGLVGVPEN